MNEIKMVGQGRNPHFEGQHSEESDEAHRMRQALIAELTAERERAAEYLKATEYMEICFRDANSRAEAERERADRAIADMGNAEARAEQSDDECRYAQDLAIRQGGLLRKAVNALRGPPPDDTLWSVHDAPELAAAVAAERDALRERADRAEAREAGYWQQTVEALTAERDALRERADRAEADLERERMRLAACSVVALSNTAETAAKAREMHPDYDSASVRDVAAAVDREMAMRERNARLVGAIELALDNGCFPAAASILRTALEGK